MTPRKKKWLKILATPPLLACLWLAGVYVVQLFWNHITVGHDTTFVDGPTRDGMIDYIAAVNDHFHQGVTPANNAMTLLIKLRPASAFPPGTDVRERTWAMLDAGAPTDAYPEIPKLDENPFSTPNEDHFYEHAKSPWVGKDDPKATEYLELQERHLALLTEACKRDKFWCPLVQKDPDDMLIVADQSWGYLRGLARALAVRAMKRLGEHDFAGFREDVRTLHRFGRLVGQSSSMIGRLVGVAIDAVASQAETNAAISGILTNEQSLALLEDSRSLPAMPKMGDAIDWTERCSALDGVARLAAHRIAPTGLPYLAWPVRPLPIHYDTIARDMNRWIDRMLAIDGSPAPEKNAASKKFTAEFEAECVGSPSVAVYGMGTAAARWWAMNVLLPNMGRVFQLHDLCIEQENMARVALVLAAWHAEHHDYPESLSALPADQLNGCQRDMFRDADLVYRRTVEGYVLYSVGTNARDDGGKGRKSGAKDADDEVITCPLPQVVDKKE